MDEALALGRKGGQEEGRENRGLEREEGRENRGLEREEGGREGKEGEEGDKGDI